MINTVIVGRVNAGKSSLLNRLLNQERAIVTPIPGTTRDVIESTVTVEGVPLRIMDTAGLRKVNKVNDEVERMGVCLTEQKLEEADFLLVVIDQSRPLNEDDKRILTQSREKKTLVVFNKVDLPSRLTRKDKEAVMSNFPVAEISALTGQGLDGLKKVIAGCILESQVDMTVSHIAPNLRHKTALVEAVESFRSAASGARGRAPMEIIAFELKSGLDALGEIIGETASEEILDNIFSQFCLGK